MNTAYELMRAENRKTIDAMREDEKAHDTCPAHPSLRRGIERLISNQEIIASGVFNNGGTEINIGRLIRIRSRTVSGVLHVLAIVALVYLILNQHGILDRLPKLLGGP